MSILAPVGCVSTVVALFGYLNYKFVKLPDAVGITAVGLAFSLIAAVLGRSHPELTHWAADLANSIDFSTLVLSGMLPVLLFAGSLHVNLSELNRLKTPVIALATGTVVLSTLVVGTCIWWLLQLSGAGVSIWYCLAFGALISPTDPIAVLGVLKTAGVPKSLEMKITGEALFNDGTAVVAFLVLLSVATGQSTPTGWEVGSLLFKEVAGGLMLGGMVGFGALVMLKGIDSYPVEILITVAAATGGYALAQHMHVSAPLAVVLIGLVIGNRGMERHMSAKTREHLTAFWALLDEVLNLVLFGLIALKVLSLETDDFSWLVALCFVPIVLLARLVSVAIPVHGLRQWLSPGPHAVKVLTWGGLRGGISVALALSLPEFAGKDLFVAGTYGVVLFSLLVQGPTLGLLLRKLALCPKPGACKEVSPAQPEGRSAL